MEAILRPDKDWFSHPIENIPKRKMLVTSSCSLHALQVPEERRLKFPMVTVGIGDPLKLLLGESSLAFLFCIAFFLASSLSL